MARPTWTLTGPVNRPDGSPHVGLRVTVALIPGVVNDPAGDDLRVGTVTAVVQDGGALRLEDGGKDSGAPVTLLASTDPDQPIRYRISFSPALLPTRLVEAPLAGEVRALDDLIEAVTVPIPTEDAVALRASLAGARVAAEQAAVDAAAQAAVAATQAASASAAAAAADASKTAAAGSASTATTAQAAAGASATAAAGSATAAQSSATGAQASETSAATSATNAATSSTTAGTAATTATSQAATATTQAANAAASATAAAASAAAAASSATPVLDSTPSSQLYNAATDTPDVYLYYTSGGVGAIAGFRTSDYIPVTAGVTYTVSHAQKWCSYGPTKTFVSGISQGQVSYTWTAAQTGFVRFSYNATQTAPALVQMVAGTVLPASPAPYGAVTYTLNTAATAAVNTWAASKAGLKVTLSGVDLSIEAPLGAGTIVESCTTAAGNNGLFNPQGASFNGTTVQSSGDDMAAINIQGGRLVGANHCHDSAWVVTNPDGKSIIDVGSFWTDGTQVYTLLRVESDSKLLLAAHYTVAAGVVTPVATAPAGTLTHVSGATKTGAISITGIAARVIAPSVARRTIRLLADGATLAEGVTRCSTLTVRESYEVLDYRDLIDKARANIGTVYTSLSVAGSLRFIVDLTWRAVPGAGLVCTISQRIVEISPTTLMASWTLQAMPPTGGTVTRYVPGASASGSPWHAGVSPIVAADILPSMLAPGALAAPIILDSLAGVGASVVGYLPWSGGAGIPAERLAGGGRLAYWFAGAYKRYAYATTATKNAGWGALSTKAFKAWIDPTLTASVVAAPTGAGAWSVLDQALGLDP